MAFQWGPTGGQPPSCQLGSPAFGFPVLASQVVSLQVASLSFPDSSFPVWVPRWSASKLVAWLPSFWLPVWLPRRSASKLPAWLPSLCLPSEAFQLASLQVTSLASQFVASQCDFPVGWPQCHHTWLPNLWLPSGFPGGQPPCYQLGFPACGFPVWLLMYLNMIARPRYLKLHGWG